MTKHPFPKTISDVAKLLDKVNPGWEHIINVDRLDMAEHNKDTWIKEIALRVNNSVKTKGLTFGEAMQAVFDGKKVKHISFINGHYIEKDCINSCIVYDTNVAFLVKCVPLYKTGWSIYDGKTFKELKAGQKFTISGQSVVYTKLDSTNQAVFNGYHVKTFKSNDKAELV